MHVTLTNCEDEPIHIPGAIQPHGALIACDVGTLRVVQVSANSKRYLGLTPEHALGKTLHELFHTDALAALRELLTAATVAPEEANMRRLLSSSGVALEAVAHRVSDFLVVEVEAAHGKDVGAFDPRARHALLRVANARTAAALAQRAVQEVRDLTGFDRVMVYRFDADWNGQVVAEARRTDLEPFLGLHYPASDIPAQARRLYTLNWLRMIGDVAYEAVPLVPQTLGGKPLDLSRAHLRSVSPIHIEYLRNMGVTASMSISLVSDGRLIGLIACHHYDGPRVLSHVVRETVQYVGQSLSWNLDVLERAELAERTRFVLGCEAELAGALADNDDLLGSLATPSLIALTQASGAAIVLDEGTRTVGVTPDAQAISEIVAWLHSREEDVFATDRLADHLPDAERWDAVAAGLAAVTLSRQLGEYLIWFRPSTERTVDWAGDPRKSITVDDEKPARLTPRGSFALWRETVRGRSAPWEAWQLNAASDVRRLLVGGARRRVAALRELNRRLTDADRAKDVFIATISHELRNPLSAIAGWSRLYLDGGLPVERRDDAMRIVARNANVLGNLVDDLLDVSRMVSGRVALELEAVDLAALIESIATSHSVAADSKGIRVKSVLDTSTGPVLGDPNRLRQVISNLFSNAVKFTPKGGSIYLGLVRMGSDVEFRVQDTGVGLTPEALERVFDAFWQVDSSTGRKERGLGLGLSIAKRLVELHGGSITAESAGLNLGTTFRVRLPVASSHLARADEAMAQSPSPPRVERALEGVRVLVVEDEEDSRRLIQHILERAGASVSEASSAFEALEVIGAEPLDVLISDVGLSGMDGLELLSVLRKQEQPSIARLPAIALTAYTRAVDRTAALRAGFQAHVPKPADPEELVAVVVSVVRRP